MSWDYNYQVASVDLFGDLRLLSNPDLVATDQNVAMRTAFWYWNKKVGSLPSVKRGLFGSSTRAINGAFECATSNMNQARKRFLIYRNVLRALNINDRAIESGCYNWTIGFLIIFWSIYFNNEMFFFIFLIQFNAFYITLAVIIIFMSK